MEGEPTGRTIDGTPWDEPRPPHLPDALTRISAWVFPFALLVAIQVNAAWIDWETQGDLRGPYAVESMVRQWLPGVCASLLGAALFYRRPDAHRRLAMLVVGVVLLNVAVVMGLGSDPLNRALVEAAPADDDIFGSAFIWSEIYRAAISVVGIFAVLYLARGLAGARRFADVVSGRAIGIALIALVAVTTVLSQAQYVALPDLPGLLTPINLMNLAVAKVNDVAWVYLFVIAFGGWLAGEQPRIGWLLAALAAGVELVLPLLFTIVGPFDLTQTHPFVLAVVGWVAPANWVLLLLAFATGLPSTEVATATADLPAATRSGFGAG